MSSSNSVTAAPDVHLDLIQRVRIASPCSVKWDDLEGDGAIRHCGQCDLNVHNLSEMTRGEVVELIETREGRLCGAFYRRVDGTMLTKDCPVGLRAVRIKTAKMLVRVAAAIGLLLTGAAVIGGSDRPRLRGVQPFAALVGWLSPNAVTRSLPMKTWQIRTDRMEMGDMCVVEDTPASPSSAP